MNNAEPFIGIFWFYNGIVMFPHAVPLSEGVRYGNAITGTKDHADYWEELRKEALSILPAHLRTEYFSIPRGRVVYHSDSDQFFVYHGNNLKKKIYNRLQNCSAFLKRKLYSSRICITVTILTKIGAQFFDKETKPFKLAPKMQTKPFKTPPKQKKNRPDNVARTVYYCVTKCD